MSYKSPPPNYNFRQNSDYLLLINNALGREDVGLLKLIKNVHFDISYVLRHKDDRIPVLKNGNVCSIKVDLQKKEFEDVDSAIEYIKEISKTNYLFIYSYVDITLTFSILPLTENINGLKDYKRDRLISAMGI